MSIKEKERKNINGKIVRALQGDFAIVALADGNYMKTSVVEKIITPNCFETKNSIYVVSAG